MEKIELTELDYLRSVVKIVNAFFDRFELFFRKISRHSQHGVATKGGLLALCKQPCQPCFSLFFSQPQVLILIL
ncbi:MAG: hypothetical protein GY697_25230 [Desulfobacterales bacterium]|nr:hypothetical protein [Desulfobacterales bacterium]